MHKIAKRGSFHTGEACARARGEMTTFENIIICESENNFDGQKGTVRSVWCVLFYLHT